MTSLQDTFNNAQPSISPSRIGMLLASQIWRICSLVLLHLTKPWCTPSWGLSIFPEKGYDGPIDAQVICCMQGEYLTSECQKCRPGFYQNQDYTQINSCITCPRNTISPLNGAINCSICAKGKFSNDGIECEACPSGYYRKDYIAHSNCAKCAVGRYQP